MSARELSRAEVMQRIKHQRLTQREAARILGVSVRQVKRLWRAYRGGGARALISRRRGRPSNHQLDPAIKATALALVHTHYHDFGPTLAREKLSELHGITLGLETLRQLMLGAGLWTARTHRTLVIHPLRARRPCLGELIQIDGSPHHWFEERGPACTLLVYVDDATSALMHLQFVQAETTAAYFAATHAYLRAHGKPIAFYSDRLGVFRRNDPNHSGGKTQFARAMAELDIELICANSPQAKGRVERANQTLQDRLIKELRLQRISNLDRANAFVPRFLTSYNRRFAQVPLSPHNAHRPLQRTDNLNRCLSFVEQRTISKNLTIQYRNATYQILAQRNARRLRFAAVQVREDQHGLVSIEQHGRCLPYVLAPTSPRQPIIGRKELSSALPALHLPRVYNPPPASHPWRKGTLSGVTVLAAKLLR